MTRAYNYKANPDYNKKKPNAHKNGKKVWLKSAPAIAANVAGAGLLALMMGYASKCDSNRDNLAYMQAKNTAETTKPAPKQPQNPARPTIKSYFNPATSDYKSLVDMLSENSKNIQPQNYKQYLESSLERILEHWYGTRWSMNGAATQPRKGSVGCDYLVIRALEGLGYNFDKYELGWETITQNPTSWLASENIVKASSSQTREFWGMSYKNLKRYINTQGDGIYVVGTDTHVGFLQKKGNNYYFMHSSQRPHGKVVKENADKVSTLRDSNVYVIGKLFTPDSYGDFFQEKHKPIPVSGQ